MTAVTSRIELEFLCLGLTLMIALASCNGGQSHSQAMKQFCSGPPVPEWFNALAPPDRMAAFPRVQKEQLAWFEKNVTNAKARELVAKLPALEPYLWSREISNAAKSAIVDPCPLVASLGPIIPSKAAIVNSQHLDGVDALPIVAITKNSISVNGDKVVHLRDGAFDESDLEGGAMGIKIKPLSNYRFPEPPAEAHQVRTFEPGGPIPKAVSVFAEPTTPYGLLFQTIATLRSNKASFGRFSLLVASTQGLLGSLPVQLPGAPARYVDLEKEPVHLIVVLTETKLLLWSVSGMEGTLTEPSLVVERDSSKSDEYGFAKLSVKLSEIIERRWPENDRNPEDYELMLMPESTTPYRIIVEFMAATQKTPSGEHQFSTILAKPSFH